MNINSLYICVEDMNRAIKFYTKLFEKEPIKNEKHTFGSNCLPSIEMENLDILNFKIKDLEKCFPLTAIGNNWVVEIVDNVFRLLRRLIFKW